MRVAIVYKRFADSGGSERQVVMLCRRLVERGAQVDVFCASASLPPPAGVTLHRMPPLPLGRALGLLRFSAWARRAVARHEARAGRFDVRHAFGRTVGQDVHRLGGGCHRTYLEQAHALDKPAWLRALLARMPHQLARVALEERALLDAGRRRVITNSGMVRDDLLFRYGLPPQDIRVIRNGTDLQRFRPAAPGERAQVRDELSLPADAEVLLFLGSGYARKGLEPALAALALLAARRPALRLLVAGADGRRASWERLARERGLAERVRFLGPRPDPERLLRAADLLLLPTAYDPAANATLEALASGVPVVTSRTNGASEILEPGVHGSIVPAPVHPGDVARAVAAWLDRPPAERQRAALAARARAEEFSDARSCDAVLEVYREIMAAGRSPRGTSA